MDIIPYFKNPRFNYANKYIILLALFDKEAFSRDITGDGEGDKPRA